MPSTAESTGMGDRRPKIWGIRLRWRGSRCWTTTMIAGKSAGSRERTSVSANTPPAEAAIATMSNAGWLARGRLRLSVRATVPPAAGQLGCADFPKVALLLELRDLNFQKDHFPIADSTRHPRFRHVCIPLAQLDELALDAPQIVVSLRQTSGVF